jgi:phosphocarrier protein HPr
MVKQPLTIINKLGLHARAAAKLTGVSARFSCIIELTANGKTVDCKSVSKGTDIEISANGNDEAEAMEAVSTLINNRFDEAE